MDAWIKWTMILFSLCLLMALGCDSNDDDEEERAGNLKAECIAQCWIQYDNKENSCAQSTLLCIDYCDDGMDTCEADCSEEWEEDSDEWADCAQACQEDWYDCTISCTDAQEDCIQTAEEERETCLTVCEKEY